jgi:hypothetical protein
MMVEKLFGDNVVAVHQQFSFRIELEAFTVGNEVM